MPDPLPAAKPCPICRRPATDPRFRPFCSARCADVDLGRWFNGAYAMGEGVGNWDGHKMIDQQYAVHGPILDQPAAAYRFAALSFGVGVVIFLAMYAAGYSPPDPPPLRSAPPADTLPEFADPEELWSEPATL